jgi:hypothetical protein
MNFKGLNHDMNWIFVDMMLLLQKKKYFYISWGVNANAARPDHVFLIKIFLILIGQGSRPSLLIDWRSLQILRRHV